METTRVHHTAPTAPRLYQGQLRGIAADSDGGVMPITLAWITELDAQNRPSYCGKVIEAGDCVAVGTNVVKVFTFDDGTLVHHIGETIGTQAEFIIPWHNDTVRVVVLGRRGATVTRLEGVLTRV